MKIHLTSERVDSSDTLILFLTEDDQLDENSPLPEKTLKAMKSREDFCGKFQETVMVYERNTRVLLVGLGKLEELSFEKLRVLASCCMKSLRSLKIAEDVTLEMPDGLKTKEQIALLEGFLLSQYQFSEYKKNKSLLKNLYVLFASTAAKEAFKDLEKIQHGVDLARELVNLNADSVTPTRLAQEAIQLAGQCPKIKTTVLRQQELEKLEAGLILAVAKGSTEEPALIIMEYYGAPDSKVPPVAIVGKGITFDTGGLNLKPTGSIETMKCDMAGAATVLGLMKAASELKLKRNFIGVIASCENAIGPLSYKPGDVFKSLNGKTVEVNNTDAEGRLVLADAITYVQRNMGIKSIIDLATLTGAITIALGEEAAGLFTHSKKMEENLLLSASETGEKLWPMPLYPEFKDQLKSSIADLKNSGKRLGGASTAAVFIEAFVEEGVEWAHLDIAGVAYISEPKHYHNSLATGFGVRLLVNYLDL